MPRSARAVILAAFAVAASTGAGCKNHHGSGGGARVIALPGSIHTVAGTGRPGFNGDGLPARESSLFWPDDIALSPSGELCILDWNNHRVRLRRPDGTLLTVMGSDRSGDGDGDVADAYINHPTNVAWDAEGRIVVACWHNHKIKRVETDGTVRTIAGGDPGFAGDGGPADQALLRLPSSIVALADGSLVVLDSGNQRVRRIDPGGRIETVAGTGERGYTGDGGPALAASFAFPDDGSATPGGKLAVDGEGGILIADAGNHVVRRIDPGGAIATIAGTGAPGYSGDGGPAANAMLHAPVDVAVAPDGSVYIADRDNRRVRRVRPDGTIETVAGGHEHETGAGEHTHDPFDGDGGPAATAPLRLPSGIEIDQSGNLYIADTGSHTIRVVVSSRPGNLMLPPRPPGQDPVDDPGLAPAHGPPGNIDTVLGTGATGFNGDGLGALATDLYWPIAVGLRPSRELMVADWNNHRIRMVRADGLVITIVGNGFPGDGQGHSEDISVFHPTGIALAPDGDRLAIAAWHNQKIKRHSFAEDATVDVAGSGFEGYSGDGGPAVAAALALPSAVAFDAAGNLYVADEGNSRIRRIDPDGMIATVAGNGAVGYYGDGGPAVEAALGFTGDDAGRPTSFLTVDAAGRIVFADTLNHRVRRVDVDGVIDTVAGNGVAGYSGDGGPATAASLRFPVAVAAGSDGSIYIADRDNHAVRRVDPAGTITTIAGDGIAGFAGDGGPAAAARLNEPHGLAVDARDNVYVADLGNGRVRVIWGSRKLWRDVVFPLFNRTCTGAACHSGPRPANNLGFDDEEAAYGAMVGKPAFGAPQWQLVVPGDSASSFLYQKLDPSVPVPGDRMPSGTLPLSERDLAVVRAWIDLGAER
jgi:sugar lactone lactonase YvrE